LALILALFLGGCDILGLDDPVEIRVRNASSVTFDEGVLYSHSDSIVFVDLEAGRTTPYKEVERAYPIATTQVTTGPDTTRLQVIDFVGEKPLEPGRYTYALSFFEEDPTRLILDLMRDR
jgi:hypothetical protein